MIEIAVKRFNDGRVATIIPLTFGRARITVGRGVPASNDLPLFYDDGW